jgi:Ser/Thr protein kinase RdoA (MazF antagonist)
MTRKPNSLDAIAVPPPEIPQDEVLLLLDREYSLRGTLAQLVSERDLNFRLDTADGLRYVVKIANATEPFDVTDFQVQALRHLEAEECPVAVPRILHTTRGAVMTTIDTGGKSFRVRVVSHLPGRPLEGRSPDAVFAFEMGRSLGLIDLALSTFRHPGESQVLLWDMQRAGELRALVRHVPDEDLQRLVASCIDVFEGRLQAALAQLRTQVIHNDLNPGNILVNDADPPTVAGVIDFGDMLRAPLIVDVAIAASYLRSTEDELATLGAFVAGFEDELPLHDAERALLYDLVMTRLAATISILYWRAAARSATDPYLKKALEERSSERFLRHLSRLGRGHFFRRVFPDKN